MITINFVNSDSVPWFSDDVDHGRIPDISLAKHVNYLSCDGSEIEIIKRCYPELVNRASKQMFFGDMAKMIYANVLCQWPKV